MRNFYVEIMEQQTEPILKDGKNSQIWYQNNELFCRGIPIIELWYML